MNVCATSLDRGMERRKRRISEGETSFSSTFAEQKRPRLFYIRLESESSLDSQDDTESVYSLQDKETDVARDTSDTDANIVDSDSGEELVTLEYDVASLSSDCDDFPDYTSSGTEDMNMQAAAEGAFAAVLLDTSLDAWEADGSTSDGSTIYDAFDYVDVRTDFGKCQLCKSQNDNPSYRYCEKCFQKCWQCKTKKTFKGFPLCIGCYKVRKTFFPPRPKPSRKRKHHDESSNQQRVHLDTLQNCLKELKNNGGSPSDLAGTSQHIPNLNFEDIVVPPEHLSSHQQEITSTRSHDVVELSDEDIFVEGTPKKKRCKIDSSDSKSDAIGAKSTITSKDSIITADPEYCSQDSGLGGGPSSQELTDIQASTSHIREEFRCSDSVSNSRDNTKPLELNIINLKRHTDENQHSDSKPESDSGISSKHTFDADFVQRSNSKIRDGEMCIMCTSSPKNGIFLHGSIGHMCCCYKCAMRVWRNCKRCPVCNCKVKNVVKLFTS